MLILLMKLLVSAGLLAFFFTRIHFEQFLSTLAGANLGYVAAALVVYLATQLVSALRWAILARPLGFATRYKNFSLYYLIGMFFNLFAPSTVGGDVTRVYYLATDEEKDRGKGWATSTVPAAVSVFMDRAVGMAALIWLGAIGLALFPYYAVPSPIRALAFAISLALVAGGLLAPVLGRIFPEDGHPIVVKLRLAMRAYHARWGVIPQAILVSFAIHLIQAWMHLLMGKALQINLPFSFCIILYPLVGTFAALPISLNGIGLREGGSLFLLGLIGISAEKGVAFGLLLFLIVVVDSLIGGLLFLLKRNPKPSADTVANLT
ncbi:MAG TPA: lysylphosphatidylglycerol synthase transmembrane domain-containing protein [Candidatus Binatia bacterium]|nr:lysylphosphatidylglycerol synthase transmembrane domain-containing protein [Candidatus Binatia bacterium]